MPAPEILDVPPAEAVEHFRARGFHVGFDWRDTDAEQHLVSFTAAKTAKLDILQDLRTAADKAIADGTTFETFRAELEPTLVRKGWWGRQPMTDPVTGKTRIVQLGSAHRLRIIFDTNIRMAYARGRWERIERLREAMPWLRYVAVQDARTRPDHLAWHGTILPVDHPFWQTHYPPNGWKCRCIVQQFGDDDLERYGYKVSEGPPPGSGRTRPWKNRRTGRVHQVPPGIDPGFQHNVGRARPGRDSANRLIEKIDDAPPDLARAAIGQPWRGQLFRRHLEGRSDADWPAAVLSAPVRGAIGARSRTVRLSTETAAKQARRHPDLEPADYARVQRILDQGEMFAGYERQAVGFLEENGRLWRAVVKATVDGSETYLVTLHKAQPRDRDVAQRRWVRIEL